MRYLLTPANMNSYVQKGNVANKKYLHSNNNSVNSK